MRDSNDLIILIRNVLASSREGQRTKRNAGRFQKLTIVQDVECVSRNTCRDAGIEGIKLSGARIENGE